LHMARRVIEEREFSFIARIRADLEEARKMAQADATTPKEAVLRLQRMETLAEATERAIKLFLRTSRLDVGSMFGVFASK
jgi:HTH-type transcriptional regulator, glycine betaine synthesis regulator